MSTLLLVLAGWVAASLVVSGGFCLLIRGGRRASGRPAGRERLRLPRE